MSIKCVSYSKIPNLKTIFVRQHKKETLTELKSHRNYNENGSIKKQILKTISTSYREVGFRFA